jgi:hypothetical protein
MKYLIPFLLIIVSLSACRKKETIPADEPPVSVPPPSNALGVYSGFFAIEEHKDYDTLNNQITQTYYTPWARVFNETQNDYAITKGINSGNVSVDYKPLAYQAGVNAYLGANRTSFDSTLYRFALTGSSVLPSFNYLCTDTFYKVNPFLISLIPVQISVSQTLTVPVPGTNGFDEIVVFVKKQDGTPLSEIKRFPAGTTQMILNPNDFSNVTLGYHQIEVIIKRYFVKQYGGKTFRFELHTVTTLTKRFV